MHIKNIWKKGIAFGLSVVMAAGSVVPAQAAQVSGGSLKAAEEKAETSEMLAHYPLQSDADDVSGNNKNAAVHGSVSWNDGLVLPGGKKTSAGDASYVTLPEGLFDGKDEVTISAWIKSNTDKGNYSALFFGTKAQSNNMPLNYWLFNPTNPSGNFKSVFTNDNNSGAPYQTEVGVSSTATTANKGVWTHYTTVLTEDSVTGYINGKKIGTTAKTKKTSDFGTGLQAYIGRSNYLDDNTYAGSFQDLRIYDDALDAQEVEDVYLTADSVNDSVKTIVVDQIADRLSLDEYLENGILSKDGQIELPEDFYGAAVTWTSDQPEVISATGKVTLPSGQTVVKLEAEVKLGTASAKRNFQITVLAKDGQIDYWKEHLQIPYVLDAKTILPVTLGAVQVDWTQGGMIAADGSVKADFEGKKKVTLKAVLNDGTKEETLEIPAYILGSDAVYTETYTRTPDSDYADKLAYSMHLAYSENGESDFIALNDNSGILYMRASENANETLTAKSMKDPYLFYTKEGGFAVAAVRTESNGATDGQKASSVMIYKTENLLSYEEVGFLDLKTDKNVQNPVCEYDALADVYRIIWNDGEGNFYQNTVKDLSTESSVSDPAAASEPQISQAETGIAGAKEGNLVALENAVGTKLKTKLSKLVNTGVEVPEKITASSAADIKSVRATAYYNDGSTASKAVNWDLSDVDFKTGGTYTVNGTVTQPTFHNENYLFYKRPDPEMVKYNGKFYFISTDENGQGKIYIRVSDTLKDIGSSEETLLLSESTYTDLFTACLWAPELHVIGDDLYLFFTGSKSNWAGVQSFVAKLKEGGDPTKTADWEKPVRVLDKDGNNLYEPEVGITLDMTYFEVNGQGYVVWAQRKRSPVDLGSWLYIATVDSTAPWKLTSDRVCISKPDYGWDNNTTFVDEGPFVIQRDGNIFLTFSGAGVNPSYCVGILTAKDSDNLLDASSWTKGNYPILTSRSVAGQYGPGHNSYVYDDDGTLYNVYHAQWNKGARSASIRRVHFDIDGMPVLDLVEERDLLDEYKNVTMQVEVAGMDDESVVQAAKEELKLENADPVIGNLTLPTEINGASVSWKSSDASIISDQAQKNENYADTPAGVVVRGSEDKKVTLTATITYGKATATKNFPLTVKKKADQKEYAAYLYIHFNEIKVGTSLQQIYFGISKDGLQWTALNDNQPILESTVGDKGVRDPYIIRSAEGDKFYLIGTDLDIHHSRYGGSWAQMATIGSQSLVIWESEDLVNWTESRLADVGSKIDAGCTWAPEAIYDEKTGEYLVFWASPLTKLTGDCNKKYIFVSKTRDFVNFTDPELYSDASLNIIDADLYKEGNKYYRLLKNSDKGYVYLQSASQLLDYSGTNVSTIGGQQFVNRGMHFAKIDNSAAGCLETYTGRYEGPTMFKFNDRDEWCILVDEYGTSDARGYIPFLTKNLDEPNSVKLAADNTYTMTDGAKHGTVIPITQEEYDALIEKWGVTNKKYKEEQKDPILTYDFEETTEGNVIEDQAQDNDGTLAGNAVYRYDEEKQSNVLYLDGTTGTYAQLPDGLFDGLDNMTVTMDIKPESTQNFHFDFTVGQDNSRYLFLRIRDNEIRTSITSRGNGQEKSAVSSGSGILGKWMNVTLVMENHKMTLYIDGKKAAEQKGVGVRNISELGSNLISYLGKSFYNDPYFKGSYDNVKVYNRALSEEEITDEYAQEKICESAKALGITEGKTVKDLTLPTSGINGTTITWKSDKPEYISETGKVTRPRAGAGNQKVTLTATISIGTVSQEYTYNMIVPEDTDAENKTYLEEFTEKFAPEWKYLWEDTKLPEQYKGMELTWKTDSPYINIKNGTEAVLAQPKPGEGEKEAILTAVFKLGNTTVEKEVKVIVEESIYGYVLSYVVSQEPDMQTEDISGKDNARTDVLHLALSTDGTSYTALNKEKGIFYPVDNKQLGSPSLFKKPDGTFGLIASADNANNKVMIYDSEDMIYYGNERVVTLTASGIVKNPEAVYDASVEAYHVYWEDADGQAWEVQTKDFTAFTDPVQVAHSRKEVTAEVPRYAKEYTALGLTKSAYQKLEKKYGNLHNTGVQKPADIEINEGGTFTLPEKLTLDYSDGSTADMKVTWNTENVNTDKAGTYEVTGTIEQTKYNDPLVEMRADPYMIYNEEDGYYYFIGSYPTMNDAEDNNRIGYDRLAIRRSKDINGLTNAEEVEVWHDGWKADAQGYHTEGDGTAYYRYFWAPEIHKIGGKWRIITYASLNRNSKWGQMAIFTCEGKDMMDPSAWRAEGVVGKTTDGQTLGGFDTTFMEVNGQCYYVTPKNGKIWITTFDPENVLQPTGPLVQLSGANMAWEYNLKTKQGIDEGPAILQHDGKIFVCYSGATVDQHYCVGMIYADADSDLMDPASWTKYPYPLLTTSDIFQSKNQYGPGHNSFSIDANGNPVIVYHARTWGETIDGAQNDGGLNDPGRHARINSVHFAADGMPVLNMTEEELLAEEYKTVTVKITVTEKQTETDKPEPTPPETETDKPQPTPPETETDKPQTPSNELKKGDVVVGEGAYGVYEYRITGKNTAEILRVTKKGKKKATLKIFKTAKLGGKKYKITSVAANALKGNKKVKTLTIEKNIEKIGKNAFANCKNLKRIVIRSTKLKKVGSKAFKGISKKAIVKVPKSKKKSYTKLLQKRGLPKNVKIK